MRRSPGKIPPEAIPVGSCCQCYIKDSIFVVHRKEYDRSLLSQLSLLVPSKKPEKSGFFRTQRSEKTAYICTHSGF